MDLDDGLRQLSGSSYVFVNRGVNVVGQGSPEERDVSVAQDPPEALLSLGHAGHGPAEGHAAVVVPLDVPRDVPPTTDHALDRVGRPERPDQGWAQLEAKHGQGLGEALAQAHGGAGVVVVQESRQRLQVALRKMSTSLGHIGPGNY